MVNDIGSVPGVYMGHGQWMIQSGGDGGWRLDDEGDVQGPRSPLTLDTEDEETSGAHGCRNGSYLQHRSRRSINDDPAGSWTPSELHSHFSQMRN